MGITVVGMMSASSEFRLRRTATRPRSAALAREARSRGMAGAGAAALGLPAHAEPGALWQSHSESPSPQQCKYSVLAECAADWTPFEPARQLGLTVTRTRSRSHRRRGLGDHAAPPGPPAPGLMADDQVASPGGSPCGTGRARKVPLPSRIAFADEQRQVDDDADGGHR